MKIASSVILIALLVAYSAGQIKRSESEADGLNGPVKSIKLERIDLISNGEPVETERFFVYGKTFDKRGNAVELIKKAGDDFEKTSFGSEAGRQTIKTVRIDSHGKIVCYPPTCTEGEVNANYNEIFSDDFNSAGQMIERLRYANDGSLFGRYTYEYDAKGRLIRDTYTNMASRTWEHKLRYDGAGDLIEEETVSTGDEMENFSYSYMYSDFKFDGSGNWIERTGRQIWSYSPNEVSFKHKDFRTITYF